MERPRIRINLKTIDYILEIIGFLGVIYLFILPAYYFDSLPDALPKHFNLEGHPDSYGGKGTVWILPIIALFLYLGMSVLNKFPHLFNYPVRVTKDNAYRLYTYGTRLLRFVKATTIILMAYLNFQTIKIGLSESTHMRAEFIIVFLVLIFLPTGIMIFQMRKLKEN